MRRITVVLLGAGALSLPLSAADRPAPLSPYQVADLNAVPSADLDAFYPESSQGPTNAKPVALGPVLYFTAADPAHGRELWRSDGSSDGTWRVSDLRPGPVGSDPRNLTVHRGRVFFTADDGSFGVELWSTDGTRGGTRRVADLCPGSCSSSPTVLTSSPERFFFAAAKDGGSSTTLWGTDGTREGTREVPGARDVTQMAPLPHGGVVFSRNGEPWRTDGTAEGTFKIQSPFFFAMLSLTPVDSGVAFWASSTGDLWIADGTETGLIPVRRSGPIARTPPVAQDGTLYFLAPVGFSNPRLEVWTLRGTPPRTYRLGEFALSHEDEISDLVASPCGPLVRARGTNGELRIWRVAGPTGPIVPVTEPLARASDAPRLWSAPERAFFVRQEESGAALWELAGDSCQPRRVTGVNTPSLPAGAGGLGFFVTATATQGLELWRSDGTAEGTRLVKDIGVDPGSAAGPEIVPLGNRVLFPARTAPTALPALWVSNGTVAGTQEVAAIPGPQGLVKLGSAVLLTGTVLEGIPGIPGSETLVPRGLWRTDGTPAGTELLAPDVDRFQALGVAGNRLLFSASDPARSYTGLGAEPWVSDGTAAGTRRVVDLNPFVIDPCCLLPGYPASSAPTPALAMGSAFLFAADDGVTGHEPWVSDGSAAGTHRVLDINLEPPSSPETAEARTAGSTQGPFVSLGTGAFFAAFDGPAGRELWVTDGTPAGTRRVRDLAPGTAGSDPHDLVAWNGRLWFLADESGTGAGQALWSTDGTEAGTLRVALLAHLGNPSWGRAMVASGTRLYFVVDNDALDPSSGRATAPKPAPAPWPTCARAREAPILRN